MARTSFLPRVPERITRAALQGGFGNPAASGAPAGNETFAKEPWFAGPMDRPEAERAMAGKKDGTFLIRRSKNHDGYSLSVIYS